MQIIISFEEANIINNYIDQIEHKAKEEMQKAMKYRELWIKLRNQNEDLKKEIKQISKKNKMAQKKFESWFTGNPKYAKGGANANI